MGGRGYPGKREQQFKTRRVLGKCSISVKEPAAACVHCSLPQFSHLSSGLMLENVACDSNKMLDVSTLGKCCCALQGGLPQPLP